MGAFASSIGPSCGSCFNSVYTLTYNTVSIDSSGDVYDVFVNINTTNYNGGGLEINAVAPKIISGSYLSLQLLSAPPSQLSGSSWGTPIAGGAAASGCSGSGSGFFCDESTGLGAAVSNGSFSKSGVVFDKSFTNPGPAPFANSNYMIPPEKGRQFGPNLFHSFSQFDLANGDVATFSGSRQPSGKRPMTSCLARKKLPRMPGTRMFVLR